MFLDIPGYLKSLGWYMSCIGASYLIGGYDLSNFVFVMAVMAMIGDFICNHWLPPFPIWMDLYNMIGSDPFAGQC